ncbi:hypothetical protein MCOR31_000228 [Pyricularia oryzae]|uniref:Uncharacterized protein n=1 Tax=Pyricularia grisea TaxID=148305 RepID=A0ABQ8NYC6_PYRGI|nr:hypothetical protein MCOR01_009601 [Pyricularia oryzae]KAI6303918.1 hypothetical protein MCOR33_001087 [Pyricularia grisea]KAI6255935.1 hypothetical protein MCOR19_007618 [Pyricularia oryzae]KAI6274651.1 hypothetical protein MCOR26_006403 [Pyricularia oryzae]KAI6307682.1 hypothetical protein MCOR34_007474 [Pyricularia oryzae]
MKKNISTQKSITRQHPPRAMYIPDHQEQQQQQQQPEQTMSEEMVQAMLRSFMYSAIVAGSVAVIAALAYCAVQLTSRDRNARGRYGDTRYIYSMTAPPIPYVMSEAAAQSGRAHHDIHTPTHGTSQFSMKELYDIMRTNIFSSDSDEANARGQDDIVNQHSSLLANADVGQRNSSLDGFGTTAESENVAPAPSDGVDRYVL